MAPIMSYYCKHTLITTTDVEGDQSSYCENRSYYGTDWPIINGYKIIQKIIDRMMDWF